MRQIVKTLVVQIDIHKPLQVTFDRLDEMVRKLGDIEVISIHDAIHNSEPPATPHSAEYGYKVFPGEAAIARIIIFTRKD